MADEAATLIPPAEIARLAGVTRAAVSNWRRRYSDFPEPAGGTTAAPLFSPLEVLRWLKQQRKGQSVSGEVLLWQSLRTEFGGEMIDALDATADAVKGQREQTRLDESTAQLARELAQARTPAGLVEDLTARFVVWTGGSREHVSTPELVRVVRHFAGETTGRVYDPACGVGDLLLSVGGAGVRERTGQELVGSLVRFLRQRAELKGAPVSIAAGDSLRDDAFGQLKAELVVCDPPTGQADWGRDELMLDGRWELGLPPKAEGELAWLQHCYFHTAPDGRALVVLPASVAYRRSGRRIRAELVRNGIVDTIVALPGGLAAGHSLPVHLWVLRRREGTPPAGAHVTLIDLTDADLSKPIEPDPSQVITLPALALLNEEVDLTPSRYVTSAQTDPAAYATTKAEFEQLLRELIGVLPELPDAQGQELNAALSVSELIRGGLVEIQEGLPVSLTEQLDTAFLQGFIRSSANTRRNTSGSGTHRADPRGARVPQMDLDRQRQYAFAFRDLESMLQRLEQATKMGRQAAQLAQDGLTRGTLSPPSGDETTK